MMQDSSTGIVKADITFNDTAIFPPVFLLASVNLGKGKCAQTIKTVSVHL